MNKNRIYELRKQQNLTQEAFSELLGVSRQSVQKWETSVTSPDSDNLLKICRIFNVSADYLLGLDNNDTKTEFRLKKQPQPQYTALHWWELYSSQLMVEYVQCIDQGIDVTKLKQLMESIHMLETSNYKEKLADTVFEMIGNCPQVENYPFNEPDNLEAIYSLSKPDKEIPFKILSPKSLQESIEGAWMGRIAGCLLGKPVEGIRTDELIPLLKETNNFPMHRYIEKADMTEEIYDKYSFNLRNRAFADAIKNAPSDDDTNYTVLSSVILDKYGDEFSGENVAKSWLDLQPKSAYCTAERVAYLNIIKGFLPPQTAQYKNPFREWIGAQIRIDYYGYINPGDPKKAALMAWKDASLSHVKNGIYTSMLISAIISVAPYYKDIKDAILYGLNHIPTTSRTYKEVMEIINNFDNNMSQDDCFIRIHKKYDEFLQHHWCHAISNTLIVVASLLYGKGDFAKSICMSVQAGFDTDCNGATVGSIIGMQKGIRAISEEWQKPINNKLDTSIFGMGTVSVDYLVDKTMEHINLYSEHYKNKL